MPELPEVENTRQYLLRSGTGGSPFGRARNYLGQNRPSAPSVGEFIESVAGRTVTDVQRRGKYLIAPLDDGQYLVLHLGMTGSLRIHDAGLEPPSMLRHTFPVDDGREMRFIDPRKFGHLWLLADPADAMSKMGPEPLETSFDVAALAAALGRRKAPIKALLLEQSVIAGLGNLYADETLYLSGIHPERVANSLTGDELSGLHQGISNRADPICGRLRRRPRCRMARPADCVVSMDDTQGRRDELCPRCGTFQWK